MVFQAKHIGLFVLFPLWWSSEPGPSSNGSYLALGDSYTIGQSVKADERYPVQVIHRLNADHDIWDEPEIIATTGWTTADLLDALHTHPPLSSRYDFVTLLIGVNNQFQQRSQTEYKEEFTALLRQAISLAGNIPKHVAVLSIPDYSITPFAQGANSTLIASQIDSFNRINRQVSMDLNVNYVDITGESRKAADHPWLIADDGLHFSGKEYAIWAGLLEPVMQERLHVE